MIQLGGALGVGASMQPMHTMSVVKTLNSWRCSLHKTRAYRQRTVVSADLSINTLKLLGFESWLMPDPCVLYFNMVSFRAWTLCPRQWTLYTVAGGKQRPTSGASTALRCLLCPMRWHTADAFPGGKHVRAETFAPPAAVVHTIARGRHEARSTWHDCALRCTLLMR